MKPLPFRLKIALLSACISGVALLGFCGTAWLLVSRQKLEGVDTEIRSLGARHPGWIANRGNYQRLDEALKFIFGEAHAQQVVLLVKQTNGAVLYSSSGWPADLDATRIDCQLADDPNALPSAESGATTDGRGHGGMGRGFGPGGGMGHVPFTKTPRFLTVPAAGSEWRLGMLGTSDTTLVIGLNLAGPRAELNSIRNAFLVAYPVALFLVGLGGWIVAGRAMRPLRVIAETAQRVTAAGLDRRIPTSGEDAEIDRVIQVLNRMMDRLEASFRQATRFSADASHELKTPLTIMQGELEAALQAAPAGSREQQTFSALLEETQRLKTITRSLLLLAQADAGQLRLAREPVDLRVMLQDIVEDARILAEDAGLSFELEMPGHAVLPADRALLHTAFLNLVVNAVKYNEAGGKVRVELLRRPAGFVLLVANSGPGIAAEDQTRIFDRFHRVQAVGGSPVEGLGLGLSLALEIVRAHGGDLILKESRFGWTAFEVQLQT